LNSVASWHHFLEPGNEEIKDFDIGLFVSKCQNINRGVYSKVFLEYYGNGGTLRTENV